ncbi:MAG: MFS transporter, partial [Oscillospiraceae bacterium]|nr:MFS transporter [Oscillospiraceae bacterium]
MEKNKYKLLLTQKNYMRLLIADLISRFGDSLDAIAYSWIMYEITASESLMALIIGLNYVPTVLFQPFLGVLADKMKKKKIMVTMDIVRGIIVGSVILLYSMNMLTPIVLGILTIVTSTVEAIRMPAGTAFLPMVLEKDYYTLGKAANYSFSRSAELVGFVLAGGMISWIGSMGVLFIDMFTFFISAIFIGTIHDSEIIRKTEKGIKLVFEGFKEGLCFFKSNKVIQLVCLIGLLINFGIMPLSVFQTPYVADYLMLGPEMLSVIKICMVLGMS